MERYEVEKGKNGMSIVDNESRYELKVFDKNVGFYGGVYFLIPNFCAVDSDSLIPVTSRGFSEYSSSLRKHADDFDLQYLEVGVGYSGFLQEVVSRGLRKKPIIIEPLNFDLTKGLLDFSRNVLESSSDLARIDKLIDRHNFLTDASKVRLYNCTLGEALKKYGSELEGVADVVVDYFGAGSYPEGEWDGKMRFRESLLAEEVWKMESKLLAPNGTLFVCNRSGLRKNSSLYVTRA